MIGVNNRFSWADQLREQGYVEFERLPGRAARRIRVDANGIVVHGWPRKRIGWGDVADIEPPVGDGSAVEIDLGRASAVIIRADRLGIDGAELAAWLRREAWSRAPIEVPPKLVLGGDEELGPVYLKRTGFWVDIDRLGLSAAVVEAVRDWDRRTSDNLLSAQIDLGESVRRWEQQLLPEGRAVAGLMAAELGPGATVEMVDDL